MELRKEEALLSPKCCLQLAMPHFAMAPPPRSMGLPRTLPGKTRPTQLRSY